MFKILLPLLLCLAVGGLVFNYFFEKQIIFKSNLCGAYKINRILNENYADEIAIFGSSRAEGGYIPDSLGTNYFNYGIAGTKYDVTLFFLSEECKKTKNNPFVILNIDLEGLIRGAGDISNYIPFTKNSEIKEILGANYHAYFEIPFIKYYGMYETYLRFYFNNKLQFTKFSNKGASLEKNVLDPKKFYELVEQRKKLTNYFSADSILSLKLFSIIQQHPDKYFIFVISPYHSSNFVNFPNLNQAYTFLDQLKKQKNVKLLDFSRLELADDMFLNTTHVNYKGAIVFNKVLRDSLNLVYANYKK